MFSRSRLWFRFSAFLLQYYSVFSSPFFLSNSIAPRDGNQLNLNGVLRSSEQRGVDDVSGSFQANVIGNDDGRVVNAKFK